MLFSAGGAEPIIASCDTAAGLAGHSVGCMCGGCMSVMDSFGEVTVLGAVGDQLFDRPPPEVGPLVGSEASGSMDGGDGAGGPQASLSVPIYHSKVGAAATLYLDFDGSTTSSWGAWSNIVTPAYDIDGDMTSFSATELSRIHEIWARVAEDFAPFDIDVTTEEPPSFANGAALRVAIGGSSYDWYGSGAGGVAYVNSFTNSIANVVFVFENQLGNGNARYVAEAASHEAGHGFGLSHQAEWNGNTKVAEYYAGANGWAPIMGVGYYQTQTTWSDGRASNGNTQDDLAILANNTNGFGYRADDHGSNNASATSIVLGSGGAFSASGIVERMNDVDVFAFDVGDGTLSVNLGVAQFGANLNAVLKLYDSAGNVLTTVDPDGSLAASLAIDVTAGAYYLHVLNNGQYGALGQYTLAGTAPEPGFHGPPEVSVAYSGGQITDGQSAAISFGSVMLGATAPSVTFTVRNLGGETLDLASLSVPSGFTVTNGLVGSLEAGESDTFTVAMSTASGGVKSGTVSFTTNDEDESVFNFTISGTVVAPADIAVSGPGGGIGDGATTPIGFGSAVLGASGPTRTFTVTNVGGQTLTISGLSVPTGFTVTNGLIASLGAGQSDTFTVRLNTGTLGAFAGEVRIFSNDTDAATFNFAVSGTVVVAADSYESNDTKAQVDAAAEGEVNSPNLGRLIKRTAITGLTLEDSADWFRFEMGGQGTASDFVRINFEHDRGDLTLTVYASNGSTIVASSAGAGDSEIVSLAGAAAGVYYARVTGAGGAHNPDYTLTIDPGTSDTVFTGGKKVGFTDANGRKVNVSMQGAGAGEVLLGDDGEVAGVLLVGTSAKSVVNLDSDGAMTVGDVTVRSRIRSFIASKLHVTGDVSFEGGASRIVLASMAGAAQQTLVVGAGNAVAIAIKAVSDLSIAADTTIKSLRVGDWQDLGGAGDGIEAVRLLNLKAAGDLDADVSLTGGIGRYAINAASIAGEASGVWDIGGGIKSLTVHATGAAFDLTAGGQIAKLVARTDMMGGVSAARLGKLVIGDQLGADVTITGSNGKGVSIGKLVAGNVTGSDVTVVGGIRSLVVGKWNSNSVTAAWIGSIDASGDFQADLTLTGEAKRAYTLGRVNVVGTLGDATWNVNGAVKSIRAGVTDPQFTLNATGPIGAAPAEHADAERAPAPLSDLAIALAAADLEALFAHRSCDEDGEADADLDAAFDGDLLRVL